MPRFVILEHDHPGLHWDLMLETGSALKTWRLAQPPDGNSPAIDATELADHRVFYLDYEGAISGGRGSVKRWDHGTFVDEADSKPERRVIRFDGMRLQAIVHLTRTHGLQWLWRAMVSCREL